jgi:hypothetical protein
MQILQMDAEIIILLISLVLRMTTREAILAHTGSKVETN